MKKLLLLFLLFVFFSMSVFAEISSIHYAYLSGGTFGAGTDITIPLRTIEKINLKGFELIIGKDANFSPNYCNFTLSNWTYSSFNHNSQLKIAAVGNSVILLAGEKICEINFHVSKNLSGSFWPPTISFFDGNQQWLTAVGMLKIINIPVARYGDLNGDGKLDINDAIQMWDIIGTVPENDTIKVVSDLSGNGSIDTWDVYLLLSKIVNPDTWWPIFNNNYSYSSGLGKVASAAVSKSKVPIIVSWKKTISGKWGLYSEYQITNGDLIGKTSTSLFGLSGKNWFKKIDNKVYFVNQSNSIKDPILIADNPIELTGTVNDERKIIVSSPVTDIAEEKMTPISFVLHQNYPNPFNPSTMISYQLPASSHVTLKIYDLLGKEVAVLVNEQKSAGNYSVEFNAKNLTSGTYFYKISAGNFIKIKKMILMK